MAVPLNIAFDLDDTLYSEIEYSHSALNYVGQLVGTLYGLENPASELRQSFADGHRDPVGKFCEKSQLQTSVKSELIAAMQSHLPTIQLRPNALNVLNIFRENNLGYSIVTDGRSVTQRMKLQALGCLDAAIISISGETGIAKTNIERFQPIERRFSGSNCWYIGDNISKDFVAPNKLGWNTVMLANDGKNIHPTAAGLNAEFLPKITIKNFAELEGLIHEYLESGR